jgi:oligoendopeptidase F
MDFFYYPRALVLGAIENIAYSRTKILDLELHDTRNSKVSTSNYKFKDSPVNWSTWRQFNSLEKNDANRKELFDDFIEKSKYISPIIEKRFLQIREIYDEYGKYGKGDTVDPVSAYLEQENISYEKLVEFLKSMGNTAKKPFLDALAEISKRVIGKEPEYYDDFYFFRNKVYSALDSVFSSFEPLHDVKKILTNMEFDMKPIQFDVEDRLNKYPSPICLFVKIPHDIRILYKRESPYFDFQACFHETGHAMHMSSVDANNMYWDKYQIPMGVAEIFSMFMEIVAKDSNYISSLVGQDNVRVNNQITTGSNFMDLFLVTFYVANSLMKLQYWKENLSVDETCTVYSGLIEEYTSFKIPGEYWLLHHILPEDIMYVPSYLLAAVRAAELKKYMMNRFGDHWWREKDSGQALREIMKPGGSIDLSIFSQLDRNVFFEGKI